MLGALIALVFCAFTLVYHSSGNTASAATGINHQINFQGKLVNPNGTNVTDGTYSIVFSIYNVASAGSAIWTETQSVTVTSGIFQVNLGSVTALPGSIDFNTDNIYLGIKVGADAEMTPRIQFTSVPQAFNAEKLGGLDKTGFIQNQTASPQTAGFNINGTATVGTSVTTPTLQAAAATALTITGNAASTWSTSAGNITLQAGSGTISLGSTTLLTSTGALSITGGTTLTLTSTGANAITLDSGTTGGVNIGTNANAKAIAIGNVTGATSVTIDCGTGGCSFGASATAHTTTVGSTNSTSTTTLQAGTGGVNVGTGGIANTIQIGSTTGAVAQTINIGNNATASSSNTIVIGSTVAGTTTLQSAGGVAVSTLGAANNTTYLCRNSSNIISTCQTNATGSAFVQGGNSFGATATLGTKDAFGLTIGTFNGTALQQRINITNTTASTNNATLTFNGIAAFTSTANSASAFQVQNASGAPVFSVDTTTNNLVSNPGFEIGTTNWATDNNGVGSGNAISQNLTPANTYHGVASMLVQSLTTGATAGSGAKTNTFTSALALSTQYTLSFYAKASGGPISTLMAGRADNGTFAGQTNCALNSTNVATNGFQRYSCTFTTGGSLSSPYIYIGFSDTANHSMYIDAVQLSPGATVAPYQIGGIQLRGVVTAPVALQATSDSITAFQIQTSTSQPLFVADTLNRRITLDDGVSTAGNLLVLDSVATANLPTGVNGGLIYDSTANRFKAYEAGAYTVLCTSTNNACGTTTTDLQTAYNNSTSPATITTTSATKSVIVKAGSGFDQTALFQIQNAASTPVMTVDSLNSQLIVRGKSSNAVLGAELSASNDFTNATNWTTTDWTTTITTATHTAGNTTALIDNQFAVTAGNTYQVRFTISGGPTAPETITPQIGFTSGRAITGDSSNETQLITASGTGALQFVPTSNWNGTISAVSVKLVTKANAALTVQNSAGTASLEVRTSTQNGNSFIGLGAGQSNTVGTQNTALGTSALQNNTTGSYNTALGNSALLTNATGFYNTASGYSALQYNTTGGQNTASGVYSLQSNTTGSYNTASGMYALLSNTAGGYNTASGYSALQTNTAGYYNTASGVYALALNTTGFQNTASGNYSLQANTIGSNNTALGNQAGYTSNSANANTTGSNNTFLGYNSGPGTSIQLQNATAIGQAAVVNANDTLTLGCISGVNGCSTTTKVGIASGGYANNPLTVAAGIYSTGTIAQSGTTITGTGTTFTSGMVGGTIYYADGTSSTITAYGSVTSLTTATSKTVTAGASYTIVWGGFNVTASGGIGIGTTSPGAKLEVQSNTDTATTLLNLTTGVHGGTQFIIGGTVNNESTLSMQVYRAGVYTERLGVNSSGDMTLQGSGGSVGIGAAPTSGAATLQVTGTASIKSTSTSALQVQNASGTSVLNIDTTNGITTLRSTTSGYATETQIFSNGNFSTGWTGANWTLSSGSATHNAGFTNPLTPNTPPTITIGKYYDIELRTNSATTGSLCISLGGSTRCVYPTANNYYFPNIFIKATNTSSLSIAPSSDFNGTIDMVNIYDDSLTNPALSVLDSSGATGFELRTGVASNQSLFMGQQAGQNNTGADNSIGIGAYALQNASYNNTDNVAIGSYSQQNNNYGSNNVSIGTYTLQSYTGYDSTALGYYALSSLQEGNSNTALGSTAMWRLISGSNNTALGASALEQNLYGSNNTALGYYAGENNTGSGNVFLGYQAGYNEVGSNKLYIANSNTSTPLIYGDFSNSALTINGSQAVKSLGSNSTTAFQVQNAAGTSILNVSTSGNQLTVGGNISLNQVAAPSTAPTVAVNAIAGNLNGTYYYVVTYVTASGETDYSNRSSSVAPVNQQVNITSIPVSPSPLVTARKIYRGTIGEMASGTYYLVTTINDNTTTTYTDNIADGSRGGMAPRDNSTALLKIGSSNVFTVGSGSGNMWVGLGVGTANTTGIANTGLGYNALNANTTGFNNSAFGNGALQFNTTGNQNTALGMSALSVNTSGGSNTGLGYKAFTSNTTGSSGTAIGSDSLHSNTIGNNNVGIGLDALYSNTTGNQNTALGTNAGYTNTSANANVSGSFNTFLGYNSGPGSAVQLQGSTAIGANAVVNSSYTTVLGCTPGINTCNGTPQKVSIGSGGYGTSLLTVAAANYTTGTIAQSGTTTVTGTGTSWTSGMVGGTLFFSDGTSDTIISVSSATSLATSSSRTVTAGSSYTIVWGGLTATNTGAVKIQTTTNTTSAFVVQNAAGTNVFGIDTVNSKILSGIADGATAVGFTFNTSVSYSTAGAKLLSLQNNGVEKFAIDKDGTITTQSVGNASIKLGAVTSDRLSVWKYNEVLTQQSTTAVGNSTDLATVGPTVTVTVPTNGLVTVRFMADVSKATASEFANIALYEDGVNVGTLASYQVAAANTFYTLYGYNNTTKLNSDSFTFTTTAGTHTYTMKYGQGGASSTAATFKNRRMWVMVSDPNN